jgi:Zinc-finger double-stranded RNA-binding/Zinc-finger of C2H2 type
VSTSLSQPQDVDIVVCQSGQGGISGVPARNPTISEHIPRLSPEEARRHDKAIQLAALRKVQHARTRAAVRHGKRKCALCGILCSSLAVYIEHVAGRKHKRLAQDTLDGPQSCEPCKRYFDNHDQLVRHLNGKHHCKIQFEIFKIKNPVPRRI